jgi:putative SOS response-associated peptidase YedK
MCGRFALYSSGDVIARAFEVEVPDLLPRYNVAPTQQVAARASGPSWEAAAPGRACVARGTSHTYPEGPIY